MLRHPCAAWAAIAFALLSAPRPAPAGPLSPPQPPPPAVAWYAVEVLPVPGQDALYLGRFDSFDRDGASVVHALGALPGGLSGTIAADGEVRLLGASKGGYTLRDAPPDGPNAGSGFRARVTVTDYATGQTGAAEFLGTASLLTALPESPNSELLLHASGGVEVVAGRTRYTFALADGDTDSSAWVFASVTAAPAATPEPGSFALAGLGLTAVGLLRSRRRAGAGR